MSNVNATKTDSPLRAARRRAGLSMEKLSRCGPGYSRSILDLSEKAPHLMSDRTAHAVAQVLGVPVEGIRP